MEIEIKGKKIIIPVRFIKIGLAAVILYACYTAARQVVSGEAVKNIFSLVFLAMFLYSLRKPKFVFYAFIFSLPFTQLFQLMRADFLCLPNILGLFILFLILVRMANGKELKICKTPLDWPILIMLFIFFISILQSRFIPLNYEVLESSRFNRPFNRSFFQVIALMYLVVLYYMTNSLINKKEDLVSVVKTWIISSLVVVVLGFYGFLGYMLGLPFTAKLVNTDMVVPRVSSILREPMFLGVYLMTVVPLVFSLILSKSNLFKRKWMIIFFILSTIILILTMARGAWIALAISLIATTLFYYRSELKIFRWIFVVFLFTVVIFFVLSIMFERAGVERFFALRFYNVFEDFSTLNRLDTVIAGLNMFKAHPVLGVGYGNYPFHFLDYAPDFHYRLFTWIPGGIYIFPNAHNIFANYLAETGILGTLALTWLLFAVLATTFKAIKNMQDDFYRPFLIGYFSSFLGVLVAYQFFSTINTTLLWVMLAVIISVQRLALIKKEKDCA